MAEAKRRHRLLRTGVALAILLGGSGLAIAQQVVKSIDHTQAIADDAALAGLHALVDTKLAAMNLSRSASPSTTRSRGGGNPVFAKQ
jgi:G3E family GTPase